MKIQQVDSKEKTTIFIKGRKLEGIKLPRRSGSGFHGGKGRNSRREQLVRVLKEFEE